MEKSYQMLLGDIQMFRSYRKSFVELKLKLRRLCAGNKSIGHSIIVYCFEQCCPKIKIFCSIINTDNILPSARWAMYTSLHPHRFAALVLRQSAMHVGYGAEFTEQVPYGAGNDVTFKISLAISKCVCSKLSENVVDTMVN